VAGQKYQAILVTPSGAPERAMDIPDGSLPLIYYMIGLGANGGLVWMDPNKLRQTATEPYVIAAPMRAAQTWWVLDSDKEPWGYIDGDLKGDLLETLCKWMTEIAAHPKIDKRKLLRTASPLGPTQ